MPSPNDSRPMSLAELLRASNQLVGFQREGGERPTRRREEPAPNERNPLANEANWFPVPPPQGTVVNSIPDPWFVREEVAVPPITHQPQSTDERGSSDEVFVGDLESGDMTHDPDLESDFTSWWAGRQATQGGVSARSSRPTRPSPVFGGSISEQPILRSSRPRPVQQTNNEVEEDEMRTVGNIMGREPEVATVTPHPLVLGTNRVGVEIEVERFNNRRTRLRYWNLVSDGSLRNNGQEFTFRGALGGKDAFDAISEIDTLLYQSNPDLNIRCSTHVHVDVRDMTVPQLKRMILAYAFYESFLFNQSGRHRMKSNFCMPLCIAEGLTHILMDSWSYSDNDFLFQVTERWDKYSAVNLIPIRSYGSVEFRMAEGKSKSGQLLRLVNRFLALKEVAMAHDDKDDRQFLDYLREIDYRMIFRKGIRSQVTFSEEDFKTGWIIANDIATLGKMR